MDNIIEPTMDYDFSKLYLGPPSTIPGGSYFTRIMYGSNKPLFIQTPKSLTKQGFVKSGKKVHTDLMFDNNDTVFINWIENLEAKCQELIYGKSESWFENKLEKDDIDTAFTSPFKIFKSGKFYLLRINVKPAIKIYDENDNLLNMDELTTDKHLISILEIQGIKFTSKNFQIEIELKQAMSVSPDPFLEECFIKRPLKGGKEKNNDAIDLDTDTNVNKELISKSEIDEFIKENMPLALNNTNINTNTNTNTNIIIDEKKFREETIKNTKFNESVMNINTNIIQSIHPANNININNDNEDDTANILLEVEDLTPESESSNDLKEFDISSTLENNLEAITLKQSNQVYYDIYKKAREKAKQAKKDAIMAYLEVKNIKKTYMIEDMDNSDEDSEAELDDLDSNISVDEAGETYN
uniref:Uncharacterized protein n=1 Tax=viral metagenome TaxID=1070528 RepID=A0A6C0ITB0_9ZZZZ